MDYNELGENLKELLKLENEPVAIKWSVKEPRNVKKEECKSRFCTKLTKAMKGGAFYATAEEEECMGGARYSGLKDIRNYLQMCKVVHLWFQGVYIRIFLQCSVQGKMKHI